MIFSQHDHLTPTPISSPTTTFVIKENAGEYNVMIAD